MLKATLIAAMATGLLLLAATQTSANPTPLEGTISLHADIGGTDRSIETSEGTVDIYVFLDFGWQGVTGAWSSAPKPRCFDAQLLGEEVYFDLFLGNTQTGLAIALGSCRMPRVLLVKLTYQAAGSLACCHYRVCGGNLSSSGEAELANCNQELVLGTGGALILNADTYPCEDSNPHPCAPGQPVPVEASTWGKVKSLYAP